MHIGLLPEIAESKGAWYFMRLSRKITTYGKELYNWNFFKIMKGYKLNPGGNWDNLTRVSFGFFDNEPNTKLSENVSAL